MRLKLGNTESTSRKDGYSGLLLPQVATEYGWDRRTFLEHTCQKAGLPSTAWKEKEYGDLYLLCRYLLKDRRLLVPINLVDRRRGFLSNNRKGRIEISGGTSFFGVNSG